MNDIFGDDPFAATYFSDLVSAMDRLAPDVAAESILGRRSRRLVVTIGLPTGITSADDFGTLDVSTFKVAGACICTHDYSDCASPSTTIDDLCQEITVSIDMSMVDEEDGEALVQQYEVDLYGAILVGRLQEYLDSVNPDSNAFILTGRPIVPRGGDDDTLSSGATLGIVVAALAVGLLPLALYLYQRSQRSDESSSGAKYAPYDDAEPDEGEDGPGLKPESIASSVMTDGALEGGSLGLGTLGAGEASYGRMTSRKALEAMEAGEDIVAEPGMFVAPDSSSNAGSSGWSSSAGVSSMNTGSMDDSHDAALAAGSTLAAMGVASALSGKGRSGLDEYVPTVLRCLVLITHVTHIENSVAMTLELIQRQHLERSWTI